MFYPQRELNAGRLAMMGGQGWTIASGWGGVIPARRPVIGHSVSGIFTPFPPFWLLHDHRLGRCAPPLFSVECVALAEYQKRLSHPARESPSRCLRLSGTDLRRPSNMGWEDLRFNPGLAPLGLSRTSFSAHPSVLHWHGMKSTPEPGCFKHVCGR